ncbi:hypothetical protein AB0E08_47435 [Streptomyces sp. NPDC048281]|uniref:hypothetical protein n=1 Tax=Streptomyces sp. NPDC048281 TaxID=3154715 RepID=UPI0034439EB4
MPRAAVRAVWIAVDDNIPQQIKDLAEDHKALRARRSTSPQWFVPRRTARREASLRKAAWLTEVHRQRRTGELLDTQDVIVEYGVREELRRRGWDHDQWDEAPDEAWNPGRWPGSRDCGTSGYPGRLSARLDDALVRRTVAACWHTSAPAIEQIQAWRDAHPGIVPPRYEPDEEGRTRLTGPLAAYMRLADQITTTGTIWRAGVELGLLQARAALTAEPDDALESQESADTGVPVPSAGG